MTVVIADDGGGFDPAAEARPGSCYGLRSMAERAQAAGGSLAVKSSPGQGTQVTIVVPRTVPTETRSPVIHGNGVTS